MWNKATNNLMIGQEIKVNHNPNSPEIFFLTPAGEIKTDEEEFRRFKGNTTTTRKYN